MINREIIYVVSPTKDVLRTALYICVGLYIFGEIMYRRGKKDAKRENLD